MSQEIVEIHAIARGTVQGVGFRATTRRLASDLGLKGSVQNLPDGSVEIYAQGPKNQIALFCQKMATHWEGYLHPLTPTFLSTLQHYDGFIVKV